MMEIFEVLLILSTLLCSLVAGFLGAFAVVIMPGIQALDNWTFIQSFQAVDRVIQNSQPIFIFVWVGSVLTLLSATILGIEPLDGMKLLILVIAAITYLLGVQLPTVVVNVPLNNDLQSIDPQNTSKEKLKDARETFESQWNRWNVIRTVMATIASVLLLILLYIL